MEYYSLRLVHIDFLASGALRRSTKRGSQPQANATRCDNAGAQLFFSRVCKPRMKKQSQRLSFNQPTSDGANDDTQGRALQPLEVRGCAEETPLLN